jgi:phenylacetate-CoA ligase
MFARYLYYLGELKRNLRMEPVRFREIQNKRLRAMVQHAYLHVPFYRRKFDRAGVEPDDIRCPEDLCKLPMTTKAEIQAAPLGDIVANNVDVSKCVKGATSGSTGVPLTLLIDKKAEDFRLALWARAYLQNGLRPWDKMAIIKDPQHFQNDKRWVQRLGVVNRKEISVFDDARDQAELIERYRPDALKGFSSSLAILADFCRDQRLAINPHSVFTGAELLLEADRQLLSSVFDCDVFDYYGCTEFSLLAWECADHMGYHMNTDGTVIEFVNDYGPVASGQRGEIICTSLVNVAMPLIRYRLGDKGIPLEESCTCGRPLPLLKMVEGRMDDFLIALDGRMISPTIFSPYPFRSLRGIKQFKVIQKRRERLTIQLVVKEDFLINDTVFREARREIERVFGEGMEVDFHILERFNKDPTGKLRQVISCVPVPWR